MGPNFLTAVNLFTGSFSGYVGTGSNDNATYTVLVEAMGAGGGAAGRTALLASDAFFDNTGIRNIFLEGAAGGGGAYLYGRFEAPGSAFVTVSVGSPGTNGVDLQSLTASFNPNAIPTSANNGTDGGNVTITTDDASIKITVQGGKGAICKATSVAGGDIPYIEHVPGASDFSSKYRGMDSVFGTNYTLQSYNENPSPDAIITTPQGQRAGRGGWSGCGNTEGGDRSKRPAGNGYCYIRSSAKNV
jgi:hypothetical protein